jgi:hypothetical protein
MYLLNSIVQSLPWVDGPIMEPTFLKFIFGYMRIIIASFHNVMLITFYYQFSTATTFFL